ncbi:hypothetical protein PG989_013353 [Apiospora arundinis]
MAASSAARKRAAETMSSLPGSLSPKKRQRRQSDTSHDDNGGSAPVKQLRLCDRCEAHLGDGRIIAIIPVGPFTHRCIGKTVTASSFRADPTRPANEAE